MKNLFVFSPIPLFPLKQGNRIRLYQTLKKFIDAGYEITYFCNNLEDSGRIDELQIAQHNKFLKKFIYTKYQGNHFKTHLRGEQTEADVWDDSIDQKLKDAVAGQYFDACITNYSLFTKVFTYFPSNTHKIVEMHDRLGDRAKLVNVQGVISDFFSTTSEREVKYLERADTVITIKDAEAKYLYEEGFSKRAITGYCPLEDKEPFTLTKKYLYKNKSLGFIGSDNRVNRQCVASIYRFASEKLEILKKHQIKIVIAGKVSPYAESILPSEVESVVQIMGEIDELNDFYKSISISINPTTFSTGFKLKNVESYSYGVPLVSSEDASDGIPSRPKFLLNKTPKATLETALNFLLNEASYTTLFNASAAIKTKYQKLEKQSWEEVVDTVGRRRICLNIDQKIDKNFHIVVCQLMHDYIKLSDQVFITDKFFNKTIYEYLIANGFSVKKVSLEKLDDIDFTLSIVSTENQKSRLMVGRSAITIRPEVKDRIYLNISLSTVSPSGSTVVKNAIRPHFIRQYSAYTSKKTVVYFKTNDLELDKNIIPQLNKLTKNLIILDGALELKQIQQIQEKINDRYVLIDFANTDAALVARNYFYNFFEPMLLTNRLENVNLFKRIQGPETQFINVPHELDAVEITRDILNSNGAYSKLMLWSPYRAFAGY